MKIPIKIPRGLVCALVAVVVLVASPARGDEDRTGKITIETMSVAAGLGYSWGNGVLEYRGEKYPFTLKGFSIIDIGVVKRAVHGEVYNLRSPEDFEGTFMAAVAGGTLGVGAGTAAMHNRNGVDMVWTAADRGLSFSLAHAGIKVTFTDEARVRAAKYPRGERDAAAAPRPSP